MEYINIINSHITNILMIVNLIRKILIWLILNLLARA